MYTVIPKYISQTHNNNYRKHKFEINIPKKTPKRQNRKITKQIAVSTFNYLIQSHTPIIINYNINQLSSIETQFQSNNNPTNSMITRDNVTNKNPKISLAFS